MNTSSDSPAVDVILLGNHGAIQFEGLAALPRLAELPVEGGGADLEAAVARAVESAAPVTLGQEQDP